LGAPAAHGRLSDSTQVATTDTLAPGRAGGGFGRDWSRSARLWGWLSGLAFAGGTLIFTVDSLGWLGAMPVYEATAAGQLHDEAVYWVSVFAYRNETLWNPVLRDILFTIAWVSLTPMALAINAATGGRRAAVQIGGALLAVAGVIALFNPIAFFVDMEYWRNTGWEQVPAEIMVSIGRSTAFFDNLSRLSQSVALAVLAVALTYLGTAMRTEAALPGRLSLVAYLGAILAAALVVVGEIPDGGTAWDILSLALGAVVAPAFAIILGEHLGRMGASGDRIAGLDPA
jgi:hypothetical protein